MDIRRVYDDFLCEKSGIIIDDAYDVYKKNEYKKYIEDNNLNPLLKVKNKELQRWKKGYNKNGF